MPEKQHEPGKHGDMTVSQAGKKGGETVKNKYGNEFYEEIGKKGRRNYR